MVEMFSENGDSLGEKPYVVVSNNGRNEKLDSFLAVRITTSPPILGLATHVVLDSSSPVVGHARCDDITIIYDDEVKRNFGFISLPDMQKIGAGLKSALAL